MLFVDVGSTGVRTTSLGLGCAGLYRSPSPAVRTSVMQEAFDVGIRHFDTAPSYGLGIAEAELGRFLRGRRDEVTVTTKFGIACTRVSTIAARMQRPVRAGLARAPEVLGMIRRSGAAPGAGLVGRSLYRRSELSPGAVREGLERSLAQLHTSYVDFFLLHEPSIEPPDDVIELLRLEVRRGRIRGWGLAQEEPIPPGKITTDGIRQHRTDLLGPVTPAPDIGFGHLRRSLPALGAYLSRRPEAGSELSDRLGVDLRTDDGLPRLLLAAARTCNPSGVTLITSSSPERVRNTALAADEITGETVAVLRELVTRAQLDRRPPWTRARRA